MSSEWGQPFSKQSRDESPRGEGGPCHPCKDGEGSGVGHLDKPKHIQVLCSFLLAAISKNKRASKDLCWEPAGHRAVAFPPPPQHEVRGEKQDQMCQGSSLGITKHIPHWRSQQHELVPIEQCLYHSYSLILPDAGAMWGSWAEAEQELLFRPGVLWGEV